MRSEKCTNDPVQLLGFSETIKEGPPQSYFDEDDDDDINSPPLAPTPSDDSPSEPDDDDEPSDLPSSPSTLFSDPSLPPKRAPPLIPPHRNTGSSSDPFLDPGDRRIPLASGPLTPPLSPPLESSALPPAVPRRRPSRTIDRPPPPQFRILTLPSYLTDPELQSLASLFPPFITSRSLGTRFNTPLDEESGPSARLGESASARLGESGEEGRVGHGEIRIGGEGRDEGWRGTGWERFVGWLKRLLRR